MERKNLILGALLLFSGVLFAQTSTAEDDLFNNDTELEELTNEEWSFFMDEDKQVYYIDFETISVNLNEVVIKNGEGEVVMKDDLWGLPVNTIYELDFSPFEKGNYEVELRSFTGVLRKTVSLK